MTRLPDAHDVPRAAAALRGVLSSSPTLDWSARAGDLTWTIADVVAHLADVCGFYAVHLAALSRRRLRFDVRLHRSATPLEKADTLEALVTNLALVIRTAPADARAWHPWGLADAAGFAAMACDELLIHAWDIAEGCAQPFEPDRDLCARVLGRLFPWASQTVDPWEALRWANGRIAMAGHPRLPPTWSWHSAPLTEWDGHRPGHRATVRGRGGGS